MFFRRGQTTNTTGDLLRMCYVCRLPQKHFKLFYSPLLSIFYISRLQISNSTDCCYTMHNVFLYKPCQIYGKILVARGCEAKFCSRNQQQSKEFLLVKSWFSFIMNLFYFFNKIANKIVFSLFSMQILFCLLNYSQI